MNEVSRLKTYVCQCDVMTYLLILTRVDFYFSKNIYAGLTWNSKTYTVLYIDLKSQIDLLTAKVLN
jgi:hypothetical protein